MHVNSNLPIPNLDLLKMLGTNMKKYSPNGGLLIGALPWFSGEVSLTPPRNPAPSSSGNDTRPSCAGPAWWRWVNS